MGCNDVVIAGGGCSGLPAAAQLNVPAGKMSALPAEPSHFLEWLRAGRFSDASPVFFAPRKVYGEYLESVLEKEIGQHRGRFTHIRAEVDPSDRTDPPLNPHWEMAPPLRPGGWFLLWEIPLPTPPPRLPTQRCGTNGIFRPGLAMPCARAKPAAPPDFGHPGNLRFMCRQLRDLIETPRQSGMCWRGAIDSLRPASNRIWQELSAEDRRRFLRHLRTYWETHRHRMAPEVRSLMDRFEKSGAVEVLAGRLRETRRTGDSIAVRIALRQGRERLLEVDRVINCTGIHESYVDCPRPLIASLIRNGLARANDLGIGFRTDSHGALIDASGGPSPILFTLGPPRRGDLFETTAVPEIRAQAEALAQHLVRYL